LKTCYSLHIDACTGSAASLIEAAAATAALLLLLLCLHAEVQRVLVCAVLLLLRPLLTIEHTHMLIYLLETEVQLSIVYMRISMFLTCFQ
jgi:hypothetical protein